MSERGSFVTEYIYCEKCFEIAKKYLLDNRKHLCSIVIPSWEKGKELTIIAGKIGGGYPGHELIIFTYEIIPKLEKEICHKLRIAVIGESGEDIFIIEPNKEI